MCVSRGGEKKWHEIKRAAKGPQGAMHIAYLNIFTHTHTYKHTHRIHRHNFNSIIVSLLSTMRNEIYDVGGSFHGEIADFVSVLIDVTVPHAIKNKISFREIRSRI